MAINKNKDYLYKDKIIQNGHIVIPLPGQPILQTVSNLPA